MTTHASLLEVPNDILFDIILKLDVFHVATFRQVRCHSPKKKIAEGTPTHHTDCVTRYAESWIG